ncbi:MAG: hypothetical protein ACI8Z5_000821 [Lentimonas sp.]|jgi:hypothetical protein
MMQWHGVKLESAKRSYLHLCCPQFGSASKITILDACEYKNDDIYVVSEFLDGSGGVSVSVGNGTVYGYVQTGGDSTALVRNNGMVTSYTGDESEEHQQARITADFYADYPVPDSPTGFHPSLTVSGSTTVTGFDDADRPIYYDVAGFSLTGQAGLTISGHVVFLMPGAIRVNRGRGIILNDAANPGGSDADKGSSITIYTADNVSIGGGGVTNAGGVASDFTINGTADMNGTSAGQTITVAGNGVLAVSVYAPNLTVNGGGSSGNIFGGVVALTATVVGGGEFHFDEALRDIVDSGGTFEVSSWPEMTGATAESTPIDMSSYFE